MKKLILLSLLVIALVVGMSGLAYAGGWWFEFGENESGGPSGGRITAPSDFPQGDYSTTGHVQQWGNPNTAAGGHTHSPHGGYSTSTNLCKTCHAVHLAASDSYRLLHDSSRITECDWCHDAATGRSSHRPYGELFLQGLTVRGEHSLGATRIPDSDVNRGIYGAEPDDVILHEKGRLPNRSVGPRGDGGAGLYCFDCHSVHGANIITKGGWTDGIVRNDPAGNGGDANVGADTNGDGDYTDPGEWTTADWNDMGTWPGKTYRVGDRNAGRSAFCSDCHTLNAAYDGSDDSVDSRPYKRSHVFGPAADGASGHLEVYHETTTVSWASAATKNVGWAGCRACHAGADHYDEGPSGDPANGDWPHQTQSHKLLFNDYTAATPGTWSTAGGPHEADALGETVGDPQRPLPEMDKVCLKCHSSGGDGTGDGVGATF